MSQGPHANNHNLRVSKIVITSHTPSAKSSKEEG